MPLVIFHVINDARSPYYCQVINILDTTTECGVGGVLSYEKSTGGKFSALNCTLVCSFVDYTAAIGGDPGAVNVRSAKTYPSKDVCIAVIKLQVSGYYYCYVFSKDKQILSLLDISRILLIQLKRSSSLNANCQRSFVGNSFKTQVHLEKLPTQLDRNVRSQCLTK